MAPACVGWHSSEVSDCLPNQVLQNCMRGRLLPDEGVIKMAGIEQHLPRILAARRLIGVACGTSWHAGLVGEYLIETLARVPVEVEYASEFR